MGNQQIKNTFIFGTDLNKVANAGIIIYLFKKCDVEGTKRKNSTSCLVIHLQRLAVTSMF